MRVARRTANERGFTILEMLVAMAVFLIICAAMFELLQLSQQRYASESQLSGSFQEARLAMDQIVRDVNVAGYPSLSLYSVIPTDTSTYAASPIAWNPSYPGSGCAIGTRGGGTCATPGDFDLIVETRLGSDPYVSWVRYYLDTSSNMLYRAVVPKTTGADPATATSSAGVAVPFLANVMNNQGAPLPIFQYTCATPGGPTPCPAAGAYNLPQNISDVDVTLIVATPQRDLQTQVLKLVELNGRGHTSNLSQ